MVGKHLKLSKFGQEMNFGQPQQLTHSCGLLLSQFALSGSLSYRTCFKELLVVPESQI